MPKAMVATMTAASASRNCSSRVRAQVLVEAGVVGERQHARGDQLVGKLLHAVARAGVDDAGAARPLGHQLQHAPVAVAALALGRQRQLRPREAVDELARIAQPQLGADVVARARVGRGGDGEARHLREHLRQPSQHAVLRTEVVAPLADAMRLVDRHQRERQARQPLQHGRLHQAFGREVEQVQRAFVDPPPDVGAQAGLGAGVELLGRDARLLQGGDLVGHQRDQRRDDEAEAGPHQRRDLVAQALAAARRQHGQRTAAGQHLADHAGLQTAEVGVAERAAQDRPRGIERRAGAADRRTRRSNQWPRAHLPRPRRPEQGCHVRKSPRNATGINPHAVAWLPSHRAEGASSTRRRERGTAHNRHSCRYAGTVPAKIGVSPPHARPKVPRCRAWISPARTICAIRPPASQSCEPPAPSWRCASRSSARPGSRRPVSWPAVSSRTAKRSRCARTAAVAGLRWWMPGSIRALAVNMLTMDEPDHTRLRSIVDEAFRRRAMLDMEPHILRHCRSSWRPSCSPTEARPTSSSAMHASYRCPSSASCSACRGRQAAVHRLGKPRHSSHGHHQLPAHARGHWAMKRYLEGRLQIARETGRRGTDRGARPCREGRRPHQRPGDGGDGLPAAGRRHRKPPRI